MGLLLRGPPMAGSRVLAISHYLPTLGVLLGSWSLVCSEKERSGGFPTRYVPAYRQVMPTRMARRFRRLSEGSGRPWKNLWIFSVLVEPNLLFPHTTKGYRGTVPSFRSLLDRKAGSDEVCYRTYF
ncbi:hypothetical protein LZ31DRAFT_200519 [Colletotrichum somersetense]|nr:hypothetical protein LZ31DRAFT_200519 [Colletotrichum somersetense]